jgi:hypothetical protein
MSGPRKAGTCAVPTAGRKGGFLEESARKNICFYVPKDEMCLPTQ